MEYKKNTILHITITLLLLATALAVSCSQDWKTSGVTLVTNGGTIAPGKDVTSYVEGKGVFLPLASDITKDDCTFGGWYDNPDFTGDPVKLIRGDARGDKTFYAKWDEIPIIYITSDTTTLESGRRYSIETDVTNDNRLTVGGKVRLYLPDGYTLTLSKGITVSGSDELVINTSGDKGTGELNITGADSHNAGIGGESNSDCGTVTINGGKINVIGGLDAAGIGGGHLGSGGKITITGGSVNATGGTNTNGGGAGIGGGYKGNGGTITIRNASVNATGGNDAAGIGGGHDGEGANLTIFSGAEVKTYSPAGKGIGAAAGKSNNGTLTIGSFDTPTEKGHLRIAEGWCLFYGDSADPVAFCEGPNDFSSFNNYCKKYMDIRFTLE